MGLMFEKHGQPLISRRKFAARVVAGLAIGLGIDLLAVVVGAAGYHSIEGMSWLDGFVNAAMVITGNGPITPLQTSGGKVFLIFDALLGALAFITVAGVMLAPIFHRLLHAFHLEVDGK